MNTPSENSHTDKTKSKRYTYAQREGDDFTCIKLLEGKYKDIIYHYGQVGFAKEERPDGTLPMKFDYTVVRNPRDVDIDDGHFIDYIGDILIELLEEQVNNGTAIQN